VKIIKDVYHFEGLYFSISFVLQPDQSVYGVLSIHEAENQPEFPFVGYYTSGDNCINLGFFIDWNSLDLGREAFSAFHCQIVNQRLLICDWLLCSTGCEGESSTAGSAFLYSEDNEGHLFKTPPSIRPYPVEIATMRSFFI
jgi:hypothetical protein